MREYIKHYDVANEISMRRSLEKGAFIVVEGVTDYRLYGKFSDPQECRLAIAYSKSNVQMTVKEMVKDREDDLVSGIVDADYDRLNGVHRSLPIFLTDTHDVETMIFRSQALENILWEYGDQDRLREFQEKRGLDVRSVLLETCYPLGILMHLSLKNNYELNFRDLDHCDFIQPSTLSMDLEKMVDCVYARSNFTKERKKVIMRDLRNEMGKRYDPWQVCRGHDMVDVLIMGFKHIFGSYNSRSLNHGSLSGSLRLAYHQEHFQETELYSALEGWGQDRGQVVWRV
ncbi:MAG: DUF4435 domain-containing protein [Candidatus Methanomethylophilaceae archaeon]